MAIDADLNAGVIDEKEAQTRRAEITRQADFFGAMDGASKSPPVGDGHRGHHHYAH